MRMIIKSLTFTAMVAAALIFTRCAAGIPVERDSAEAPLNPDRGWYRDVEIDDNSSTSLSEMKEYRKTVTIVLINAELKNYASNYHKILANIDKAFEHAQKAGLSVIFRAAYDFPDEDRGETYENSWKSEPEDIATITGHIAGLRCIFYKYEAILLNVQAGFLGPWGEWHSSRYSEDDDGDGSTLDDPASEDAQKAVVDALLEAVPPSVSIALRRPGYIQNITGSEAQTVTDDEAFGNSNIARLAFHNDSLLSDETDMETYKYEKDNPRWEREELAWVQKQTRYTPMVAETNMESKYNNAAMAIPHLDKINILSLNLEYDPEVLNKWKRRKVKNEDVPQSYKKDAGDMSAYDYIEMKMGYRFLLNSADINETGGNLRLNLDIENTGFGHLLKRKKFELILKNGDVTHRAKIDEDARFWNKNESMHREYYFSLPPDIALGNWDIYLGLSSPSPDMNNPAYSVRFFAGGNAALTWDEKEGLNKIGVINLTRAGNSGNGKELRQIPQHE